VKSEIVSRWLGVGANFGVLLGLFLLWTEISQNKQMTRVELGAGQVSFVQQNWLGATTGTLSEALSVAIYEPEKLTKRQLVALDHYMRNTVAAGIRVSYLVRMGVFDLDSDVAVWTSMRPAMGNQFAHSWFSANRSNIPPQISSVIDRHLSDISPNRDRQRLDQIEASLGALSQ